MPAAFSGQDRSIAIAIDALTYLAGDSEHLGPFLALGGIDPGSIRDAARSPGFLSAVLEYVCGDESLLRSFCAQAKYRPEEVDKARQVLAGPAAEGLREG